MGSPQAPGIEIIGVDVPGDAPAYPAEAVASFRAELDALIAVRQVPASTMPRPS